jgi:ferredoxin
MRATRKIIEIDEERCDGCGQCVISCAEGAIQIIDGKAKLVSENYCDGLGACLGECPQGALRIVERTAEEFDPEAVERHLEATQKREAETKVIATMPCGCPSNELRTFEISCENANQPVSQSASVSALSHWPVQIRLVPANAPFLKGADLLVAADCTPVAYSNFHRDFIRGRVVLLGCPKFDDKAEYVKKFAEIFRTAKIKSVAVVEMEVPCCSALPAIVRKGMENSGESVPIEEVVISSRGEIVKRYN